MSNTNTPSLNHFTTFLTSNPSIQYIRFQWTDLSNMTRFRIIPIAFFKKILSRSSPNSQGMSVAYAGLGLVTLSLAEGFSSVGEWVYVPDLESLRVLGYAPGQASVMGYFRLKEPSSPGSTELEVPFCPRTVLSRVVENAKKSHGITFIAGFESEFILASSLNPLVTANTYGWHEGPAIPSGSLVSTCLEDIATNLGKAGIELEAYHSEAAPGQYEFVTGARTPLEAADNLVCTRETIYNTATKHGLRATFAPRLHFDSTGSACHVHFSLKGSQPPTSANIPDAPGLNTLDASFLQSLLDHLPSVCAFTLPLDGSYARMLDGVWSGGTYVSWGRDNRETPVRLCGTAGSYHFELRCSDGTANPYLALAAIISAGMIGVGKGEKLRYGAAKVMPALLSEEERVGLGIKGRLPMRREEARDALVGDKEMEGMIGEEVVKTYVAVNETLSKVLLKDGKEGEIANILLKF